MSACLPLPPVSRSFRALFLAGLVLLTGFFSHFDCLAQNYGRDTLEPIGPYLDGVFPREVPGENGVPQPPALLSQTGAFTNLTTLTPRPGLLPYDVNAPLWTDRSLKGRWIALPNDGVADTQGEKIRFFPDRSWSFPAGTVFIKHFALPVDARDPSRIRPVETRFLVRLANGMVYGVTYRWREDGSDADLLLAGASGPIAVTSANGTVSSQTWAFPSRADCLSCHNAVTGFVLGVRTHQLNGDHAYASTGRTDNQLRTWNHLGLFSPALDEAAIPAYLKSAPLGDLSASLEHRVRSYLDANCSQCHQPGVLASRFDVRLTTPLEDQGLVNGSVLYDLGVPDARVVAPQSIERSILHRRISSSGVHQMPPIGRNLVDDAAVTAISQWIMTLDPGSGGSEGNRRPVAQNDEVSTAAGTAVDIPVLANDSDLDGDPLAVSSSTQPANGSVVWLENGYARYVPRAGYTGADLFTYSVTDGAGGTSNQAVVTVRVFSAANSSAIAFLDRSSRLAAPSSASGVGMAVVDLDRDGRDDIVHLHQGTSLRVDYQEAGGGFSGHVVASGNSQLQWGMCVADADGDGYPDILTGGYYDNLHVYWSRGQRGLFDRADITNPRVFLQAVNFVDMDGDGLLDVFACHDVGDNAKFRNGGGRRFVYDNGLINTRTVPSSDNSGNYGSVWTDYDGDGDLDLYLSKCRAGVNNSSDPRRVNMFFRNNGNGTYTNVAASAGLAFGEQSWAADFGDIDNDGDLDCFVGNHGARSVLMRNDGDGSFTDITTPGGIDVRWRVIQTVFRDFNNDGWLDLLLTGDDHALWLNDRDGTFTRAANPFTAQAMESCAVGDLNRDGFTDVYAGYALLFNTPQPSRPDKLFLAEPNGNGFLSVTLEGSGANTSAIGARLELHGPWGIQVREIRGGEGYGVTHSLTQIFGLGNVVAIDKLRVRWPSGTVDELVNPEPNGFVHLREGSAAPPVLANPGPQANEVGDEVSLNLEASDPTGDLLQYSAFNLPAGLAMNPETGSISGVLETGSAGSYTVIVRASDAWQTVSQTFAWDVRLPEAPPAVILSTNSSTVNGAFEVRAQFTRPVTGLAREDFVIGNGAAGSLAGAGSTYRLEVTPTAPGEVTIRLPEGAATDERGKSNTESNVLPVSFRSPATAPVIASFEALPGSVAAGQSVTLTWDIQDGGAPLSSLAVAPGVGSVLGQTQVTVTPSETVTYTLTATNAAGQGSSQVSVTVEVPSPTEDLIGSVSAPGSVAHGERVQVRVPYAATSDRELWVWLQDSNDAWRTAAQGNVSLRAGSGMHIFELTIDPRARVGDGFVWVVRLLPPGWQSADDAVAEDYSLADVRPGTASGDIDLLGVMNLPVTVESPSSVTLEVPYQVTQRREIRIFLHDSQNGWSTIAQGNATVDTGAGTRSFDLRVLPGAREGSGYVWAVRLLPLGWTGADDALDADYGNVTVARNTGGTATQDILTRVEAPTAVRPSTIATVTVEFEATQRLDLGVWLHDSTDNWRTIGHGLAKVQPGPGVQTFDLGIVGDARLGDGYVWAVRLLPEGWRSADEAADAFYKDAVVEANETNLINLAVLPEARATQSSVYGSAFVADLARDGNTDGNWRNGSVTHTEWGVDSWWEVDLGSVSPVDHVLIWNRTDCCGDRLGPYHVFISEVPFVSSDAQEVINQPGVMHHAFVSPPSPTHRVEVGRDARYVRVQLDGADYLSLAEVEVYASPEGWERHGVTYAYFEGIWDRIPDFGALHPLRTGTLSRVEIPAGVREDFYGIRYRGCVIIPQEGDYTFTLRSDEGSRLEIDGALAVDNDRAPRGVVRETSSTIRLTEGMHPFELSYFEAEGGETLELFWAGPGFGRQPVPASALALNEHGRPPGFHYSGRRVPAGDNADGDLLDLTAEYALGRNPYDAAMSDVGFDLEVHEDRLGLDVAYLRPANQDAISYVLELSVDLVHWTVVPAPDVISTPLSGWESVRYQDVHERAGVDEDRGFVRLRIRHHDWQHETTTPVLGWVRTTLRSGYQTHAVTLNAQPIHASYIVEAEPENGRLTLASGGLREALGAGSHYLELLDGDHEGHRFGVDAARSTDQVIVVDLHAAGNTMAALPATGLRFTRVLVRRHRTVEDVYPPALFEGSLDPAEADQVQFFTGAGYEGHFLLHGEGRRDWVALGDPELNDRGSSIIPPGVGNFVKRSGAGGGEVVQLLVTGHVRENRFAQPLAGGAHLLAPPAPLAASPAARGLTWEHGFTGDVDPLFADQIWLWRGDEGEGEGVPAPAPRDLGYRSLFLLDGGTPDLRYWTDVADDRLANEDQTMLFSPDRAFFLLVRGEGHPGYRVTAPEVR